MPYFHLVFSLPKQIADIAYHNKTVIYGILFKAVDLSAYPNVDKWLTQALSRPAAVKASGRK